MNEALTIFCLHYLGGSGREYSVLATELQPRCTLVPIDLAGFGECWNATGFSVTEMAESVIARIGALAAPRWGIIGHSMGAKVAAVVARRAEQGNAALKGLSGLVMLAGSPPAPEPMDDDKRRTMLGWFRGDDATTRAEAALYISQNVSKPLSPEFAEQARDDVLRMNRRAWSTWLVAGSREDWADKVGVLETPALLIAGADDASLGADAQRTLMLPHFKNGRLRVLEDATHLLPMEKPHAIARMIDDHVATIA